MTPTTRRTRQSREQQYDLIRRAQAGDERAMAEMIEGNVGLVTRHAQKWSTRCTHLHYDDLLQEGKLGMLHAIQKFDLTRQMAFSTYATHWVMNYIRRAIENQEREIRLPTHILERNTKLLREGVENAYPATVTSLDATMTRCGRLAGETENFRWIDLQTAPDSVEAQVIGYTGPGEELNLLGYINALDERRRDVIIKRFGLDGHGQRSLQEVANLRGCSRENVRQDEARALKQLRKLAGVKGTEKK